MSSTSLVRIAWLHALLLHLPSLQAEVIIPAPPQINARAHLLIDHDSGRVLAEHAADEKLPPASLTKIMTLYVVASELAQGKFSMDDRVTVSEKAWRAGGSKMFIEVGKQVSVSDLVLGVIVPSGNDASIALSEYVSGSEEAFADAMNHHAAQLGMGNSNFVNGSGLPSDMHYSSARDMALLASALIHRHPAIYRLHDIEEYTYGGITQRNRNRLLWQDDSVDGVKTGHTEAAGYCLVSSALRDGMRLIAVVLGAQSEESRVSASHALLNYGFRFYETGTVHRKARPLRVARIWKGYDREVRLGLREDLVLTWPRGAQQDLQSIVTLAMDDIIAPVSQSQELGELRIEYAGAVLARRPLLALHDVAKGSVWHRMADQLRLWWPGGE